MRLAAESVPREESPYHYRRSKEQPYPQRPPPQLFLEKWLEEAVMHRPVRQIRENEKSTKANFHSSPRYVSH